jgi:hypothetical protein
MVDKSGEENSGNRSMMEIAYAEIKESGQA